MGRHAMKPGESASARAASRREAQRAAKRPPLPYPVDDGRRSPAVRAAIDRRSQRRRSRLAALSAASMLAVGGAAGMSMAMADEPGAAGGGEVAFSGGCGALGVLAPTSSPDSAEITVTKGSPVGFVNDLGTDADLHVGGEVYEIDEGSTQVFSMNQSAEVAMVPDCRGLFAEYGSAQVTVVAAPDVEDDTDQSPEPSEPSSAELPDPGSGSAGQSSPGGDSGPGASEADDARQEPRERGEPSEAAEDEAEAETAEEESVNSFGLPDDGVGSDDTELAADSEEVAAVDPKAVSDGASGLLALVAIVCLVGVSAAVMRTILKQRASA